MFQEQPPQPSSSIGRLKKWFDDTIPIAMHNGESTYLGPPQYYALQQKYFFGVHRTPSLLMHIIN